VIKLEGGGDSLFVLRKTENHFESLGSTPCAFVQLTGKHQLADLEPADPNQLPEWSELAAQEVSKTRFWWGGKGRESFALRTMNIRFFLSISEPRFRRFKTETTPQQPQGDQFFGLWDPERRSLVLAKDDWLIAYGNASAREPASNYRCTPMIIQWKRAKTSGSSSAANPHFCGAWTHDLAPCNELQLRT